MNTLSLESQDVATRHKVSDEQIKLLYEQTPIAIISEFIAAFFLCLSLWGVISHSWLISWFASVTIASGIWRAISVFYYKKYSDLLSEKSWLALLSMGVFFSGISWGAACSLLIPEHSAVHQTYIMIMFFGVIAAANSLYSPIRFVYIIFLFPAFIPFSYWLFSHGGEFILLGYCSFVYVVVMLSISYYTNQILIRSLKLRFQLVNLDSNNHLLEKKVEERTAALLKSLATIESILECTADGVLVVDSEGLVDYYNQQFLKLWGIPKELMISHNDLALQQHVLDQLQNPDDFLAIIESIYRTPDKESYDEIYFKDGKTFERYSKPHKMHHSIVGRVWSFRDITTRKKLSYQVHHDQLTGLPNRSLLNDRVEQAISYADRSKKIVAVLFLDIDHFKAINDTMGHDVGDLVLKEVALRLSKCTRHSDTMARLGGDEFVLLFISNERKNIVDVSSNILDQVAQPIQLPSKSIIVTVSIGISLYPEDGTTVDGLLKNADTAMYYAKKMGRNNAQFYTGTGQSL